MANPDDDLNFIHVEYLNVDSIADVPVPECLVPIYEVENAIWNATSLDEVDTIYMIIENNKVPHDYVARLIDFVSKRRLKNMKIYVNLFSKIFEEKFSSLKINPDLGMVLSDIGIKTSYYGSSKHPDEIYNIFPENTVFRAVAFDDIQFLLSCQSDTEFNINDSAKIHSMDDETLTLLDISCKFGSNECFKFLIMNGASQSPFTSSYAVEGGSLEIIRILAQNGTSFNTLSSICCEYHHNQIFDWLLHNYQCPMFTASESLLWFNMKAFLFLYENGVNLNTKQIINYNYEQVPLTVATMQCNTLMTEFLISHGADVNVVVVRSCNHRIQYCSHNVHFKFIKEFFFGIIQFNFVIYNVQFVYSKNSIFLFIIFIIFLHFTPLTLAIERRYLDLSKLLIENGAEFDTVFHYIQN
ncbi:hypothetical protein TVAG_004680 [Trichomonas vaginalis G3]|uniref:Uncharacterized protein n=1 Tax=Trichomonas vaginalis (strain ATCC PRA-98 / G3) TaxID=412133 RepID=A2DT30_TRIV3|nr:protein ubiquitination [Trichomonas vaginalis G3]EAY16437.1 hypothetical protein TVAG_004680 [Trichomonas vaginalis G3]KAI5505697.1 protein ubiquitination [Trichomonas vaginalis G3]|eukprot:XP_001328660.1 hypothetical protein [Trichomonas vaginalis G3]